MNWWDDYYIVDAHAHIGSGGPLFGVSISPDELRRLMRKYNYSRCIVMSRDNEAVARAVKGSRELLANVWVNPREEGYERRLREYLKRQGFIGIKLHPSSTPSSHMSR